MSDLSTATWLDHLGQVTQTSLSYNFPISRIEVIVT